LTGRTITWETSVATTATVSASGLVTGVAAGSATITASSEGKSATSAVTVRTPAPVPVASITVAPQTATIEVNATHQLAATTRDAGGAVLTGRVVTWESLNQTVATVSASGLVTGLAAGTAMVRGTSEAVSDTATITVTSPTPPPPPPPANGIPDPTLLPRATGQHPLAGTYGRNLAAGQTYVDPNSGVTVLKLTSSSVPTANGSMYHGYSEGGPVISQPWTGTDGQVYYTAYIGGWLVDIRYATFTPTNYRRVDSDGEVGFAFSLNPATPRIAYTVTNWGGNRVDRYNTATNQVENTGHWPWIASASGQYLTWLQNNLNDEWFVAMLNSNHTVVAFRPSDGTQRTITGAAAGVTIDEPHIDREFPYIYLSTDSPVRNRTVNLETMAYTSPRDPNGVNADDHAAPMRGKLVAITWEGNGVVVVDYQGNVTLPVTPSPTDWRGDWHMAGQWVFNNPTDYFVVDQWQGTGSYAIYKDMIGFVNLAGDMRLIAHSNGTGQGYDTGGQPHPTLAPDGKLLMFVSNMGGAGRSDVFMVRLPVR
jgi:hypothetical protein